MFHVFKGGEKECWTLNHQLLVSDDLFLHKFPTTFSWTMYEKKALI